MPREWLEQRLIELQRENAQGRALLEELLKARERLWNGASEWNSVSAFLEKGEKCE
jgi:hypothetical protein